jgi:hypothetical protein
MAISLPSISFWQYDGTSYCITVNYLCPAMSVMQPLERVECVMSSEISTDEAIIRLWRTGLHRGLRRVEISGYHSAWYSHVASRICKDCISTWFLHSIKFLKLFSLPRKHTFKIEETPTCRTSETTMKLINMTLQWATLSNLHSWGNIKADQYDITVGYTTLHYITFTLHRSHYVTVEKHDTVSKNSLQFEVETFLRLVTVTISLHGK